MSLRKKCKNTPSELVLKKLRGKFNVSESFVEGSRVSSGSVSNSDFHFFFHSLSGYTDRDFTRCTLDIAECN